MEGSLYKKARHLPSWNERYFVLKGNKLIYSQKPGDRQVRDTLDIMPTCTVSAVELCKRKAHRPLYAFVITWPAKQSARFVNEGSTTAETTMQLGSESKEQALTWKAAILRAIEMSSSTTSAATHRTMAGSTPASVIIVNSMQCSLSMFMNQWKVVAFFGGLEIWQEKSTTKTFDTPQSSLYYFYELNSISFSIVSTILITSFAVAMGIGNVFSTFITALVVTGFAFYHYTNHLVHASIPSFKISKVINASPTEVFNYLMDISKRSEWDASIESAHVIQTIDDNSDILHIIYKPVWIWPIWLPPRDLCLIRYWRKEDDGSYVICLHNVQHPECRENPKYIRASCAGGGFTIAPKLNVDDPSGEVLSSLITHVVHMNPNGFISSMLQRTGTIFEYIKPQIMSVIGLDNAIENCKFVSVNPSGDISTKSTIPVTSPRPATSNDENSPAYEELPSTLPRSMWSVPEPGSMLVRGPDYLTDGRKIPSLEPAFTLAAVDIFETEDPIEHIASHPDNLIQSELKKYAAKNEDMPFTFLINIIIPAGNSKYLSAVFYYRAYDNSVLTDQTPFAELMSDFLEGDDKYRDERFKLIPCVVDGTFIIRQAVGSTPAIIGKKLRQPYYQGVQYFELDIDISSSAVANRVTGLVLGYTKKLVIDLGFLIQGQTPDELPERLFGAVRFQHADLSVAKKLASIS